MRKRVYLSVGDRCVRFEACLDLTIEKLDFHKAVKASLELDVCRSTLTIALMDCTFTLYLFNYKWGKQFNIYLLCVCDCVYVCICVCVCMCIYMYVCVYVCVYMCIYIYIHIHVYMYVCVYVCMCNVYVCMYVYIHFF